MGRLVWTEEHLPPLDVLDGLEIQPGVPIDVPVLVPHLLDGMPPANREALEQMVAEMRVRAEQPFLDLVMPSRYTRSSPGWSAAGFEKVANLGPAVPERLQQVDDRVGVVGCEWDGLAKSCRQELTNP
jgi:hypothetical protein